MDRNTVQSKTAEKNLCVSCGICKAVCPSNAIEYVRREGCFVPEVNHRCVSCGICVTVCPGISSNYTHVNSKCEADSLKSILIGKVSKCYVANTKDSTVLQNATSGGIVTTIIKECLHQKLYDSAFCVETYDYGEQVKTSRHIEGDIFTNTQKSRYIPVSHEYLVEYMRKNPTERIIITATSCAIQGILKVIDFYKLDRTNYLLIGLFCDKVMSYNIQDYFADKVGKKIKELYFRNKMAGGWPGNVSIVLQSGERIELAASERMKVKKYFQLERCLYCLDKLNQFSDISVGDNYTHIENGNLESSIIIRTDVGQNIWDIVTPVLNYREVTVEDIAISQAIENRKDNIRMSNCYEEKQGECINVIPPLLQGEVCAKYDDRLKDIQMGKKYLEKPKTLYKKIYMHDLRKRMYNKYIAVKSCLGKVKRRLRLKKRQ